VYEALKELGVTAEGAVYIGDSDVDIETAENCGMKCISVTWGLRDEAFLVEHGAVALVHSPVDLKSIILPSSF
jgi:phosphoglycolate phosphatase